MEKKQNFVINAAFYAIIAALVVALYKYIVPILMPFVVGFFVASVVRYIMHMLKLNRAKFNRQLAVGLCAVLYVLVVGLLILVGANLVTQTADFCKALPDVFNDHLYPFFVRIAQYVKALLAPIDPSVLDWIIDLGKDIAKTIGSMLTSLSSTAVKWVANGAISVPNALVTIILTVVSTFYIAGDYYTVLDFLAKLIPQSKRSYILDALRYAKTAIVVYVKSYCLLFFLTFAELAIGLLVLRIPYAVLIALGIAVFDLMPVLGTGGILLPWMVVLLVIGNIPLGLGIGALYLVITAVRHAVEPRIVGNQIGLHPLATLVALILGLKTMGLLGMMLFPISLVAYMNLRKTGTPTEKA